MGTRIDLTGQRFGRLVVIDAFMIKSAKEAMWKCRCDCGNYIVSRASKLKAGKTKSCGCLKKENARKLNGIPHKRLSKILNSMKERCYKQSHPAYKNYGGRGITICDEWMDGKNGHNNFVAWALSHGYNDDLSIDRIDNNGNYDPSNCRWSTAKRQNRNTRVTRYIDYKGSRMCIADVADITGINASTLRSRIKYGWSNDRLFSPVDHRKGWEKTQ